MRVVDRATFLALPFGTVYCKGREWSFAGLNFKRENAGPNDWCAVDPAWVQGDDSKECFDRLEEMRTNGASYPMQDSTCRDACFEPEALFLVLERDDLLTLRGWVDTALAAENATDAPSPIRYAIGDLGPARRHIDRLKSGVLPVSPAVLMEIEQSINRCVARLAAMDVEARSQPPLP